MCALHPGLSLAEQIDTFQTVGCRGCFQDAFGKCLQHARPRVEHRGGAWAQLGPVVTDKATSFIRSGFDINRPGADPFGGINSIVDSVFNDRGRKLARITFGRDVDKDTATQRIGGEARQFIVRMQLAADLTDIETQVVVHRYAYGLSGEKTAAKLGLTQHQVYAAANRAKTKLIVAPTKSLFEFARDELAEDVAGEDIDLIAIKLTFWNMLQDDVQDVLKDTADGRVKSNMSQLIKKVSDDTGRSVADVLASIDLTLAILRDLVAVVDKPFAAAADDFSEDLQEKLRLDSEWIRHELSQAMLKPAAQPIVDLVLANTGLTFGQLLQDAIELYVESVLPGRAPMPETFQGHVGQRAGRVQGLATAWSQLASRLWPHCNPSDWLGIAARLWLILQLENEYEIGDIYFANLPLAMRNWFQRTTAN